MIIIFHPTAYRISSTIQHPPPPPPAIVPAFHSSYLEAMVSIFSSCALRSVAKLEAGVGGGSVEMEAEFSSLALDIIGLSVFNYDFGSVTKESPVIQAAPPPF